MSSGLTGDIESANNFVVIRNAARKRYEGFMGLEERF
jgi:hypothetical protein